MSQRSSGARLRLSVDSPEKLAIGCASAHVVGHDGCRIGSGSAAWWLNDDRRWIASLHAEIIFQEGVFCLRDLVGLTWINDAEAPLGVGRIVQLCDGDRIRIGRLLIGVATSESHDERNVGWLCGASALDELLAGDECLWTEGARPAQGDSCFPWASDHGSKGPREPLSALDSILERLGDASPRLSAERTQAPSEDQVRKIGAGTSQPWWALTRRGANAD